MSSMKERAVGTAMWAEDNSVSKKEIADRLVSAETDALKWKAAQYILSNEQLAKIERLAEVLCSIDFDQEK